MKNKKDHTEINDYRKNSLSTSFVLMIILVLTMILLLWFYNYFYPQQIGPEQPIPFSHRLHAGEKEIGCFMCHDTAPNSAKAGMPPVETCMLCHQTIIIHYPEIEKLREHFFSGEPVEWKKVINLPDYVYFNHSIHLNKGIDCSQCHGNVSSMDRIEEIKEIKMGFCIDCHQKNNATTDCFTCHR